MKKLYCVCGQPVYFENHSCSNCNRVLAFDPDALQMDVLETATSTATGRHICANHDGDVLCNWLAMPGATLGSTCMSCVTSRIIPALDKRGNRQRWRKLERAKRRLIYDLLSLDLPVDTRRLSFVFKEDQRTNPNVHEEHVSTGHSSGEITINAAEADDAFRAKMRQQMNEPYRTLLGHFRHESGHYYFHIVVTETDIDEARALFGDERADYAAALQQHYSNGPPANWHERFISSYATTHPFEDWAETWAHYLHICSVLETATTQGLLGEVRQEGWPARFVEFALKLNEISRSLGLPDAYPFVLTPPVVEKLNFIRKMVEQYANRSKPMKQTG